jgi:ABC-type transporter Mla subunit MlaD
MLDNIAQLHQAMDIVDELNRQAMEQDSVQLRQAMEFVNELNRQCQAMEDRVAQLRQPMGNVNELNRQQAMEQNGAHKRQVKNDIKELDRLGAQWRQAMDNVNELKRQREAFVNAQQQVMIEFQGLASGGGGTVDMIRGICDRVRAEMRLVSHTRCFFHSVV